MKYLLAAALAALAMASAGSPGFAAACPADPVKASYQIWGAGVLNYNQTETGTHPCGRKMICTGGNNARHIPRTCNWM
jgi:hypothetical protein